MLNPIHPFAVWDNKKLEREGLAELAQNWFLTGQSACTVKILLIDGFISHAIYFHRHWGPGVVGTLIRSQGLLANSLIDHIGYPDIVCSMESRLIVRMCVL